MPCGADSTRISREAVTSDPSTNSLRSISLARRPNYGFQKHQKELKKQKKREQKAEKKRLKGEGAQPDLQSETDPQDSDQA